MEKNNQSTQGSNFNNINADKPVSYEVTGDQSLPQNQDLSLEIENLEAQLRMTLEELARLQNALAEANMKISAMENGNTQALNIQAVNPVIPDPVIAEIFQPLQTITSYADLLLGESVGILGTLQKKFVERIINAAEGVRYLIDTLNLPQEIKPEYSKTFFTPFVTSKAIDAGISNASFVLRTKQVTLGVEIADSLDELYSDQEIFEKIIKMLLENACKAVNIEGSILVSLQEENINNQNLIVLFVQNSGKSIPQEDLENVFSAHILNPDYKIEGLGKNLREMATLKMLVSELGGTTHIDSNREGTRITVNFPNARPLSIR